jgi:hypothetical protein
MDLENRARELRGKVVEQCGFSIIVDGDATAYLDDGWNEDIEDLILTAFKEVQAEAKEEVQDSWVEAINNLPEPKKHEEETK